jgi:flagellar basal body rod protein FlgC
MSPIASIALSGLSAASSRLETAAHNIANAQTAGFRRQLVQQAAQAECGVTVSIGSVAATGDALIEDVVAQMSAAHSFEANVMTLKAHDRLLGNLLDATA